MDSRLIFESNKAKNHKFQWELGPYPDSEWSTASSKNSVSGNQEFYKMLNYFDTDILHVSIGRKNSFTTDKNQILSQIEDLLTHTDFHTWNENFTRTIEFNKIGVCRHGKHCS